ncbi:MAG: hypothetical protein HQM08_17430 [Candidatus Riflebacteria bacterium]|nr:hypothetical protein [Candidatus Riflebacteria bacterium]
MIRIFANVNGISYDASIPTPERWGINASRPRASRQSLAGNVIHQVASKDISTAEVTYSNIVPTAECEKISAIDTGKTSCFLSDGYHLYEVIIDAQVNDSGIPRKKLLTAKFNVVRMIL